MFQWSLGAVLKSCKFFTGFRMMGFYSSGPLRTPSKSKKLFAGTPRTSALCGYHRWGYFKDIGSADGIGNADRCTWGVLGSDGGTWGMFAGGAGVLTGSADRGTWEISALPWNGNLWDHLLVFICLTLSL